MLSFILALVLVLLALLAVTLDKVFDHWPAKELKRRSRTGNANAQTLYHAAAYGASLQLLLAIIIVLAIAGSFVLFSVVAPPLFAFIIDLLIILLGFFLVPAGRPTSLDTQLALWCSPGLAWLLHYLNAPLEWLNGLRKHRSGHTGLYEKDDLLHLLSAQSHQSDSRISQSSLDLLERALTFEDRLVRSCMTPRKQVRMADAREPITPVIIRDLHATGHSYFPVFEDNRDNIVGTLYLKDITHLQNSGKTSEVMSDDVFYVHEADTLAQALHAFLVTKHHLFIVVNKLGDYVGIITIEDLLVELLGHGSPDNFIGYDNASQVVARHENKAKPALESPPTTTNEKNVVE